MRPVALILLLAGCEAVDDMNEPRLVKCCELADAGGMAACRPKMVEYFGSLPGESQIITDARLCAREGWVER